MATIYQIPFSVSFPYRKPFFYDHRHHQQPQLLVSHLNPTRKLGFVCFACSVKQTRVRKRVKSNEDLRIEIMEFVALTGLPEGHVPSMKELSAHGRVDLANIVRRRGYKFIRDLLASSSNLEDCNELVSEDMETSSSGICLEDSPTESQGKEALDAVDEDLSTKQPSSIEIYFSSTDGSITLDQEKNNVSVEDLIANSSHKAEEHGRLAEDESLLAGISNMESQGKEALDAVDEDLSTKQPSSTEMYLTSTDGCIPLDQEKIDVSVEDLITNSSHEAEEHGRLTEDESSLAGISNMENSLSSFDDSSHSGEIMETDLDIECMEQNNRAGTENSYSVTSISADHSVVLDNSSSCSDREADNVLMTEDEEVSDGDGNFFLTYDHYTTQDLNYTKHVDIATESTAVSFQSQEIDDKTENPSGSADDSFVQSDGKDWMLGLSSSTSNIEEKTARFIQNGYLDIVDGDEYIGDSYGGQRSVSTLPNGNDLALEEVNLTTEVNSFDRNSDQRDGNADLDNSNDETLQRENQVEITRLRFMLRQKELELSRLKEQIEKEKLSLSVLQRQAETEIQKAQLLISEKDVELQEAEGNLTGLQEVEIEYCGDGNVVEVTGSFNGWQHRVVLEHQASKSIGKEKWWSTLLWLYPGRYEIKFIVDGQWTTDPLKDSVTRGHITNNILKVDTS